MNKKELKLKFIVLLILTVIILPVSMILLSGNLYWLEGWLLNIWIIIMGSSLLLYLYFKDPKLLIERLKTKPTDNLHFWDRIWMNISYILFLIWLLIMPIEAERLKLSPEFLIVLKGLGILLLLLAYYFLYQATVTNTYLSNVVRIQADRGQKVIDTGVYGLVRHPMYLGATLMAFGASLLLGSIFGVAMAFVVTAMVIYRIQAEEKILLEGLEGYDKYIGKVRFRLLPFIW